MVRATASRSEMMPARFGLPVSQRRPATSMALLMITILAGPIQTGGAEIQRDVEGRGALFLRLSHQR